MSNNRPQRLQKILAQAGYGSRRACEQLILQGRVRVNGQVVTQLGVQADPRCDVVEVDGKRVQLPEEHTYILLHKPAGVVTTRRDAHAARTVIDLLQGVTAPVFPVGRLDADTTGALLLTDDGELAYRLTHPRYGVPKTYLVEVRGEVKEEAIRRLREGVALEDGTTAPAQVQKVRTLADRKTTLLRLTIHEGRKRQVKRMCTAVGHPVVRLHRERFGPLTLRNLPAGAWRHLTAEEVTALRRAVGLSS
ncbi:Ribosomal large subunit pseudouridine synthase B [bacterium HR16]|nr:Ribosomal large subunit pseudouridine synthase B [bacterium HR16]